MTQRDLLLSKFQMHGGVLTTADFAADRKLSCEYRRLLCELRKKYTITKRKIENNLFEYRLQPPADASGQLRFV